LHSTKPVDNPFWEFEIGIKHCTGNLHRLLVYNLLRKVWR